jgi:KDO2-lipid IV(A) lauroyltransferase
MKDLAVYILYRFWAIIVNLVPESFAYFLGRQLGNLIYVFFKGRRRVAMHNLKLALDVDDLGAAELTKASFQHLGMILIEFLRIPQLTAENVDQIIEIEGIEHLQKVKESGEGFVIFSGHFGNWELLGTTLALKGFPVNALARDQNNELINEDILKIRESSGVNIFANKGMTIRKAYQVLQKGEGLFVLGDQKTNDPDAFVDFFGVKATAKLGTVTLAARTNSAIIPVYIARLGAGRHKIIVKEPLKVDSDISEEGKKEVIEKLHSNLEDVIREYPAQWLWAHKRWKHSPDLE